MSDEIGDLIEKMMKAEWRVPCFFSLTSEVDKKYVSPVFFFAGLAWELWVYPNGNSKDGSQGDVGLYVSRKSSGPPKTVTYSVGLRKADGEEEVIISKANGIFKPGRHPVTKALLNTWGKKCFLEGSNLLKKKDHLAPADFLTVTCTLSVEDENSSNASLTTRLWNLSLNSATLMSTHDDTDVRLELPDGKLNAHKLILKARSPVFGAMFSHDMKECQIGEVKIEDADKKSFEIVLAFIYTGEPSGLSAENAKDVYRLSHKYDLRDLTNCCSEFLRAGLSEETICDAVTIADLYQDKKLMDSAIDYFARHKEEIRKTDQWKALKEANAQIALEMLEYTLDKM